jgi:hypothetical protein
MIYPQIIKVNCLEPIKALAWPMGQFHAIKKVRQTFNHVHMLKTGNPMVVVPIYSDSIFI